MLKLITSLSFLYGVVLTTILLYGAIYYRNFIRGRYQRNRFPLVYSFICLCCLAFLWINFNAPLQLKTYSNLDHHFLRQDGFGIRKKIELGGTDTVHNPSLPFSRFIMLPEDSVLKVESVYAEEPFYRVRNNVYNLLSPNYACEDHKLSFDADRSAITLSATGDGHVTLMIEKKVFSIVKPVRRGSSVWNIIRDQDEFINSEFFNNEKIAAALKNILLLRNNVSEDNDGDLRFFLSSELFTIARNIRSSEREKNIDESHFSSELRSGDRFVWGIASFENSRNQYTVRRQGRDSFMLMSRYPVSYPLTEENRGDWSTQTVNKFLVSGSHDMKLVPPVFKEGFLFANSSNDVSQGFRPVLLSYSKSGKNDSIQLRARPLQDSRQTIASKDGKLALAAVSGDFDWLFSIDNTYNWHFSHLNLSATAWQLIIFASLLILATATLASSLWKKASTESWVWQVVSCVIFVLLTTRFLLYWRYKSFPPFESLDRASLQQLESISNFAIIVLTCLLFAFVFGYKFLFNQGLKKLVKQFDRKKPASADGIYNKISVFVASISVKTQEHAGIFLISWVGLLLSAGLVAYFHHFDIAVCRHLAIGLVSGYFVYQLFSYRFSPLVASENSNLWEIDTSKTSHLLISNPMKVLLSCSLLLFFLFIDIGFAIVFLNFLLFNEAFLCVNYTIAGLSSGSMRNARVFGFFGVSYLILFVLNLLFAPYIFGFLLRMPASVYAIGYCGLAVAVGYLVSRLSIQFATRKRKTLAFTAGVFVFLLAFFFFPKEKILNKAAVTKYRVDVLTEPVDKAIAGAYKDGKTYEPVIRAAQNQWFINTFVFEENNPFVQGSGFHLLPHAPQNKGAKYNAQATDLVASRFLVAEHGKWSVLLYVLLLALPAALLSIFYKLYPDFTTRTNKQYPLTITGFAMLNYLLMVAMLVILAATGRYIFFGQDLPFGSLLSKQSIIFPAILMIALLFLFKSIPQEQHASKKKIIPAAVVFALLFVMLFLVRPVFNRNREFGVENLVRQMDDYIGLNLQPVMDHFDSSAKTKGLSLAKKDQLFTDSLKNWIAAGNLNGQDGFFKTEISAYARAGFARHLDFRRLLYLNANSGHPKLAVNENYFRVEPPPHLQQVWKGNVFGDSTYYNVSIWDKKDGTVVNCRATSFTAEPDVCAGDSLLFAFRDPVKEGGYLNLYCFNRSNGSLRIVTAENERVSLRPGDSLRLRNPSFLRVTGTVPGYEKIISIEPDAFMRNYYVNGNRYYVYPMEERLIWARNFAEAISSDYSAKGNTGRNAFVSFDFELMDTLFSSISAMMRSDTAYKKDAEYAICIADDRGRLVALNDFIKGLNRPDPNDKSAFLHTITDEGGFIPQSLLRKQIGNLNLLRLNPGPGSTLKPIVFSAIASQLNWDWEAFSAEGFLEKQHYFGGEKVAEYDFEKNNGRINSIVDYLKYSDNYYHSNVVLLGSYPKQDPSKLLSRFFVARNPGGGLHWPYFSYTGKQYWLNGFENWPGYSNRTANFGSDSSFTSIGLSTNFKIGTHTSRSFDGFNTNYDSSLFMNAVNRSGFLLPEYPLFDQQGEHVDHHIPYDLFTSCFRGHVKGSSQVMIPPAKMLDAYGKMLTLNSNYTLTLNPYATPAGFHAFDVDGSIAYNHYLSLMRESVFRGMREALFRGTAAKLGSLLKNGQPYFYFAKTGTTGDDKIRAKSKLLALVISARDITDPAFNFRNNKFYTIYFTSQNGPAKQNEEFEAAIIRAVENSTAFRRHMTTP